MWQNNECMGSTGADFSGNMVHACILKGCSTTPKKDSRNPSENAFASANSTRIRSPYACIPASLSRIRPALRHRLYEQLAKHRKRSPLGPQQMPNFVRPPEVMAPPPKTLSGTVYIAGKMARLLLETTRKRIGEESLRKTNVLAPQLGLRRRTHRIGSMNRRVREQTKRQSESHRNERSRSFVKPRFVGTAKEIRRRASLQRQEGEGRRPSRELPVYLWG